MSLRGGREQVSHKFGSRRRGISADHHAIGCGHLEIGRQATGEREGLPARRERQVRDTRHQGIGPRLEAALMGLFSPRGTQQGMSLLNPDTLATLLRDLNGIATTYSVEGRPLPLITPPTLRVGVRRLIEPVLPNVPVISLAELPASVNLTSVATWELPYAT